MAPPSLPEFPILFPMTPYATTVFGCDWCATLCYGRSYLGADKTAASKNVQRDGRGALHLRSHYTGGAFAGAVVAAAPKLCMICSGREPIRTFCCLQGASLAIQFPGQKRSLPSFLFSQPQDGQSSVATHLLPKQTLSHCAPQKMTATYVCSIRSWGQRLLVNQ